MFAVLLPNVHQLAATNPCSKQFLGLETWFNYLPSAAFNAPSDPSDPMHCTIQSFNALGANSGFLLIALAVLDDLIRIAGLVAVGYVIWGGIQYVTSQGSPDATRKAQHTIINALIGVGVAIIASSAVAFIGKKLVS